MADEGERRLAAILSADVAGYSKLMGDDERATVLTLTDYREVFGDHIARHKGRLVDSPGDNLLAEFASPVEALNSAVDIQHDLASRNRQLAEHRQMHFRIGLNLGDVIAKDDGTLYGDGVNIAARLEGMAEPGGICLSETVYFLVEGKVNAAFEDIGAHEVKNNAKPVRTYRVVSDEATFAAKRPTSARTLSVVIPAAVVALVVAGLAVWQYNQTLERPAIEDNTVLALPTGPSIAVLPFENMSGDPEQEYFSDGLTEDIITRLTRFPVFFVIARNSTYQYKGQAVDVREVGRDLGARYVVEGSVRKSGDSIRVTVQLLDAEDGTHLWAETYDRDLTAASFFEIQDEITDRVSATIADERGILWEANAAASREKPTDNLDAYECWLRLVAYNDARTPDLHLEVRNCAERSVETDPNYARAWIVLAYAYLDESRFGLNPRPGSLERALEAARRAVQLDGNDALAHLVLALIYFHQHDLDRFRTEGERAIALNPNNSTVLAAIGTFLSYTGKIERGSAMVKKAAALNPNHPGWYYFPLSFTEYENENYDMALECALKINLPGLFWNHVFLAAAYGQLGRTAEGRATIDKLLEIYPDFAENAWEEYRKFNMSDELIRRHLDGLRKAGLDIPDEPATSG